MSLYLVATVAGTRYAVPTRAIREVLPRVEISAAAGAPRDVAGLANYRGDAIPILDFAVMLGNAPTAATTRNRILVIAHPHRLLGLLVPDADAVVRLPDAAFHDAELSDRPDFLDAVATDEEGVLHRVAVDALLSPELARSLSPASV